VPDLFPSPRLFPHAMDAGRDLVLLVERSEADFRAASFLDDRSLKAGEKKEIVGWGDVAAAVPAGARRDVQYIFHIGHVGSTLIARLLGEQEQILALREPLLLRSFFDILNPAGGSATAWEEGEAPNRLDTLTALLSRTFRPDQRALVKATSFTSEIAPRLVPAGSRALLLHASARRYVENILAGDASRQELHHLAESRTARLARRLGRMTWNLPAMTEGERAALAWASEMASLHDAAAALPPGATGWCDFDEFLAAPAERLLAVAGFFGQPLDAASAQALCGGRLMTRYSKAPEYEYSPRLREEVLADSRSRNRAAIAEAMAWLDSVAREHPLVAACLDPAGRSRI
jgi:hypothetical protein